MPATLVSSLTVDSVLHTGLMFLQSNLFPIQLPLPEMISICSGYCLHTQVVISDHFSKMPFVICPSSLPMVLKLFCTLESPENSKAQEGRPSVSFFLNSAGVWSRWFKYSSISSYSLFDYFIYTFNSLSHLKSILICDVQWGYRVCSFSRWKRQTTSYQYSIFFINLFKHHCNFRTVSSCLKEDIVFTSDWDNLSLPSPKPRQPLIYFLSL